MNTLIIIAHPSKYSFSHKIAKKYEETKKKLGDNVRVLDLYKNTKNLPYLSFTDVRKDFPTSKFIKKCQDDVLWSNEIILIFPMWNGAEPAILKDWFDVVMCARFAFKYTGKLMPEPLLSGRIVKIIVTCDGPNWAYKLLGNPLKKMWSTLRFNLCGIKLKTFITFDKMRLRDDLSKEKLLKKIELISIK